MAQLVAHHTGSVGVTGSNPVSSTNENCPAGYAGQFFVSWGGMDSPIGALRVVGGGAGVSRVCFAGEPLPIDAPSVTYQPPTPAGLVAVVDFSAPPAPLVPLYLRRPDAVPPKQAPKSPALP